jgi:putative hydrolase of the HAD superfamily
VTDLPDALLVDLDDTLLCFAPVAEPAWLEVCERWAPRLERRGRESVAAVSLYSAIRACADRFWRDPRREGRGRLDLAASRREIVADAFALLRLGARELARDVADDFSRLRDARVSLLPGAVPALESLRARGITLVMVTNGSSAAQRAKLERFDLARHFDGIFVEGEVGAGKPDPRIFRAALEHTRVSAERAWMVGDNLEWDVAGAQRLGMRGIWVDGEGAGLPAASDVRPDHTVRRFAELALSE